MNAHHQNGKAEKKIRDLQDIARTMLLHAYQRWPNAVLFNLWTFAIRHANEMANTAPSASHPNESPLERFAQIDVKPQVKVNHTFGTPVYVLDARLQHGKRISKWSNRARVGMHLGSSPRHSRKVALVLNLLTGLVLPQCHCRYDDLCDTLKASAGNVIPASKWQAKAGFEIPEWTNEIREVIPSALQPTEVPNQDLQNDPQLDELSSTEEMASLMDDDEGRRIYESVDD